MTERRIINMPIFVRYKKSIYKINIKDGIFIIRNQVWLFTRRVLRLLKRILLRSSDIFIILLCVTAFSTLIVPMGIFIEKYNNWYDVFWDMRTFFLTSIIIAFVLTNLNEEKSRRINLYKQFYMYSAYH